MDNVAGGSENSDGIRSKVKSFIELCRKNKTTLNPDIFCVSTFEISSDDTDPNPMIRPTKLAVNKAIEFPESQTKKDIQRFVGLMNTLRHWSNKLNATCPNIRSLASKNTVWSWIAIHKEEFKKVKEMAAYVNFLSPFNPEK